MSKSFIPAIARAIGPFQGESELAEQEVRIDEGQQINLAPSNTSLANLAQPLTSTQLAAADVLAVMSAEGIAGCAPRMSAATALMAVAPNMSGDAVVAFVTAHIPQAAASETPKAQAYEAQRVAAAGLAAPASKVTSGASLSASRIYEMRRNQQGK